MTRFIWRQFQRMFNNFLASLVEEVGHKFTDEDEAQIKRLFFTGLYTGMVNIICVMDDDDINDAQRTEAVRGWIADLEGYFLNAGLISLETAMLCRSLNK